MDKKLARKKEKKGAYNKLLVIAIVFIRKT